MKEEKAGIECSFYDSYAIYAIALGQGSYAEFAEGIRIVTTIMNIYEAYYVALQNNLQRQAEVLFNQFLPYCVQIDPLLIKKAAAFRLQHQKKHFSYVDALGYTIALQHKIPFLTGDDAFRDFEGVLFVK